MLRFRSRRRYRLVAAERVEPGAEADPPAAVPRAPAVWFFHQASAQPHRNGGHLFGPPSSKRVALDSSSSSSASPGPALALEVESEDMNSLPDPHQNEPLLTISNNDYNNSTRPRSSIYFFRWGARLLNGG